MGAHHAMEFLQTPGQVTVLGEFLSRIRRIYLDQPVQNVELAFNGHVVGKWVISNIGTRRTNI